MPDHPKPARFAEPNPDLQPRTEPTLLQQSRARCREVYDLDPRHTPDTQVLESGQLIQLRSRIGAILPIAEQECESLYLQSPQRGFVVMLTDADGAVLKVTGDPAMDNVVNTSGLIPGALWSERLMGTNGIGTALHEKQSMMVHKTDHYFTAFSALTCSAAPIEDHLGNFIGALDISSFPGDEARRQLFHTRSLAQLSARHIERQHFMQHFCDQTLLHFHPRREFLGICSEGLLAIDENGRICGANNFAVRFLGTKNRSRLLDLTINEVFPLSLELLDRHLASGKGFFLRDQLHEARGFFARVSGNQKVLRKTYSLSNPSEVIIPPAKVQPGFDLDALAGSDAQMRERVADARQVLNLPISVLLTGETGCGKELFAQALHQESLRAHKPMVAKNCAAIPESLIESELFGHIQGAFTGANPTGMKGCIVEADGGTLFLDEIGDMPLAMQSRLLRVLETQSVQPLGSAKSIKVDINVISSTNRDLAALISEEKFRLDLYFRLNGITIALPALRDRQDLEIQFQRMVHLENVAGKAIVFDRKTYDLLLSYHWPGNFRELRNTLRLMIALAQGGVISERYIPGSILERLELGRTKNIKPKKDDYGSPVDESERILNALEHSYWNLTNTAKHLNISRSTLYRKMNKFGIRKVDR